MIEMTHTEIMRQMRLRMCVQVPVQMDSKKVHFRLRLDELAESRVSLQDALKTINEKVKDVEGGEAKFAKKFLWGGKEKGFVALKKK
jgi:transketolase